MVDQTTYELLKELESNGVLKKLLSKAIINFSPIINKEIYEYYLGQVELNKHLASPVTQSVHNTSAFYQVSESSVWKIKKMMES